MSQYQKKYLKYKNKYISLKSQVGSANNNNLSCSICLDPLEITDLDINRCINFHYFHRGCITNWCITKPECSCPICRDATGYIPPVVIPNNVSILTLNRANLLERYPNLLNLQEIYLQNNQIQNIDPQTFQNLPALEAIYLSRNQI